MEGAGHLRSQSALGGGWQLQKTLSTTAFAVHPHASGPAHGESPILLARAADHRIESAYGEGIVAGRPAGRKDSLRIAQLHTRTDFLLHNITRHPQALCQLGGKSGPPQSSKSRILEW
jgi:hypothetical protein